MPCTTLYALILRLQPETTYWNWLWLRLYLKGKHMLRRQFLNALGLTIGLVY